MKFMNLLLVGLFAFAFTFLSAPKTLAASLSAVPIQRVYITSPVLPYVHAQLIASTVKGIAGVQVNNTGPLPIKLAFGGSGVEVDQVIIGGNQDTGFLPLAGGYATRLSVISIGGSQEVGQLQMNVFYN